MSIERIFRTVFARRGSRARFASIAVILLLAALSAPLHAAPAMRVQVTQHGNFLMIGNTLGHDCAPGTPAPVVGSVQNCGSFTADSAPDVYWQSDNPQLGSALADVSISPVDARSTAILNLPPAARVTHAYVYWVGNRVGGADTDAKLDRAGANGFSANIVSSHTLTGQNFSYSSMVDITSLVVANGSGAYRISGVDSQSLVDLDSGNPFIGWWMVVFYENDSEPLRSLTLYDGLDMVSSGSPANITLSGFNLPASGYVAQLGVVALEGDSLLAGDGLALNGTPLGNAQNPASNVFNGSHSALGAAVSTAGDLPRTTGTAGSLSGLDIDTFDVTALMSGNSHSATLSATSSGDTYFLASMVTSFTTFRPDFGSSAMTVMDLNGGAVLPGDTLEYTVSVANNGNDYSDTTVLENALPAGLLYVPGSLQLESGANTGPKTDAAGDDQAEYVAATRKVRFRVGAGANATTGGTIAVGEQAVLRYRVTVAATSCAMDATFGNQATIRGRARSIGQDLEFLSDGDPATGGQQPTLANVDAKCLSLSLPSAPSHGSVTSDHGGFSCAADTCTTSVATGASVTLTAVAEAGYRFVGWGQDCSTAEANTVAVVTMNDSKTCSASFVVTPHTVNVLVSGLVGSGLVARLNDSENLALSANGPFNFATPLYFDDPYAVTIATEPSAPAQTCSFAPAVPPSGTMPDADITLVLECAPPTYTIGGDVSGLVGTGLILRLNGVHDLPVSADGGFVFAQPLADLSTYAVTIERQPTKPAQTCVVSNGSGTLDGADVSDVVVLCPAPEPRLTLSVTDGHGYARYGRLTTYRVTLANEGEGAASGVSIGNVSPPQLDADETTWICPGGGGGATCSASGSGAFADTGVTLPGGRDLTWIITAPVRLDAEGSTVDYTVDASGAGTASATDSNILVLLRSGFDVSHSNGTEGIDDPRTTCVGGHVSGVLLGLEDHRAFVLPSWSGATIDTVFAADAADGSGIRVERVSVDRVPHIRLVSTTVRGEERASAWARAAEGATLTIGADRLDDQAVVSLDGADVTLALPRPSIAPMRVQMPNPTCE